MSWVSAIVALNIIVSSSPPVWTVVVEDDSETRAEWVTSIHAAFTDLDEELTDMSFDLPSMEEQAKLEKMFNCEAMNSDRLKSSCVGKMARMRKASYCLHIGLTKVDGNVQMTYSVVDDQGNSHFTVQDYVLDEAPRVGARLLASKVRADLHGISPTVLVLEAESSGAEIFIDGENMGNAPLVQWSIKAGKHFLTISDEDGTVYSGSVDVKAGEITRIKAEELETIQGGNVDDEEASSGDEVAVNDDLVSAAQESAQRTDQPIAAYAVLGLGGGSAALAALLYGSSWAVNLMASAPSEAEKEEAGGLTTYRNRRDTSVLIISGLLVSSGMSAVAGFLGSAVGAGMVVSHYSGSE
jgi:hypothetical protein